MQYSNTQPIADAVCGYVFCLCAVCTCPTAVNHDHITCNLICTKCVSLGGGQNSSAAWPPIPRGHQKRAFRSHSRVRGYAAALRSGLDCALSSSTCRYKSEAGFFSAPRSMPRCRGPHSGFVLDRQHPRTGFFGGNGLFPPSRSYWYVEVFFVSSRPCGIILFFYTGTK